MMGRTHLTTGVTSAAWTAVPLAAAGVPGPVCLVSLPVGAYAALLPDWDHHGSAITWSLPPLSNLVSWVLRGGPIGMTVPPIIIPLFGWVVFAGREWHVTVFPWYFGHRRGLHTEEAAVVFGLVLGFPMWWLPPPIGPWWWVFSIQIAIGCLTHLWGDMRTTGGLRKRGGHPRQRRNIGRTFDTGSDWETYLRSTVYRPVAIMSVIGSLILVDRLAPVVSP